MFKTYIVQNSVASLGGEVGIYPCLILTAVRWSGETDCCHLTVIGEKTCLFL